MQKRSQMAAERGFVCEIDEPSSRGSLVRFSPEGFDVLGRFCISADGQSVVFAGTQGKHEETLRVAPGCCLAPGFPQTVRNRRVSHLWKVPISGGSPVKVTSGGDTDCNSPSYTPDGKNIVFAAGGTLWRMQENGSGGRTRIPGSGSGMDLAPHVSKDGKVVFFSMEGRPAFQSGGIAGGAVNWKYFIWVSDANGGNLTQIREGRYPMWSPDGTSIVFEHGGDIWKIRADGTELTQLTTTPLIYEGLPSSSADGMFVVYVSNEGKDSRPMLDDLNIWKMNVDGTEKVQITELSSWDSWPLATTNQIYFLSGRAALTEDSRLQRIWRLDPTRQTPDARPRGE
jgi:Tol biopolymer transport system component